jgi:hypothetical protein
MLFIAMNENAWDIPTSSSIGEVPFSQFMLDVCEGRAGGGEKGGIEE